MFTSFNENDFWKAIYERDYTSLKINTVSSMLNDPTFARGETKEVLKTLHQYVPDIFEEEVKLDYEERLEPSIWDKRYFTKLTYWFQENFAESRVKYIKEVGRAVHKDTEQKYNESINQRPIQPTSPRIAGSQQGGYSANPTQAPETTRKPLPVLRVVVAVIALVLVVISVVNLLTK